MKWSTEDKVDVGFGLALLILAVIGTASYLSTTKLIETAGQVGHTHKVLGELEGVFSHLKDVQRGVRGYVITADEGFLQPYYSGIQVIDQEIKNLRQFTKDDPDQQQRLDNLEALIEGVLVRYERIIDLRKNDGFDAAAKVIQTGVGKQLLDKVRDIIDEMKNEENELLKQRDETAEVRAQQTTFTILFGSLLALLITGTAIFFIKRDITKRKEAEEALQREQQFLKAVLDNIQAGIVACDAEGVLTLFNPVTQELHGLPEEPIPADDWAEHYDLYLPDGKTRMRKEDIPLFRALQEQTVRNVEMMIVPKYGEARTLLASGQAIFTPGGKKLGAVVAMHDITERKRAEEALQKSYEELEIRVQERTAELAIVNQALRVEIEERKRAERQTKESLEEKEVLLKEIHHRVKNNLQIISSLLNLQSKHIKSEEAREKFKESQNRVKSMALIHEKLYQSENLVGINFRDYIKSLSNYLFSSYGANFNVKLNMYIDDVSLSIDKAIPCGLIINEIVSNSLKYAFPDGANGEIRIELSPDNGNYNLIIANDGVPFPKNVDFRNTESLGLQLVCALTEQLKGDIELRTGSGTEFKITFSQ